MLIPEPEQTIPEMTVRVAQRAFPAGNIFMTIRDQMGPVFEDGEFATLYPRLGQPAESPARLALVTLMQYIENLPDRQAADAVRARIDWKYALGLELADAGFHYSVLSEFRTRLVDGGVEAQLFDTLLQHCRDQGLLTGKREQRTDSTYVLAAVRDLCRLEVVGETMRRVLDDLAHHAPLWLKGILAPEWSTRYLKRFETTRLPKSEPQRQELALAIGTDGYRVWQALHDPAAPPHLRFLPSVEVLRRIWLQQYYLEQEQVHWRTKQQWGQPPARVMLASPDDVEAHYSAKYEHSWVGYKVHLTETCAADAPHLITHVETTPATTHDVNLTPVVHEQLAAKDLVPTMHLVDAGYLEADILTTSQQQGIDLVGPVPVDKTWQGKAATAFDHTQFHIDWEQMQVTCPGGQTSSYWLERQTRRGTTNYCFTFHLSTCRPCPLRSQCTQAQKSGRTLTVYPPPQYEALEAARQRQQTEEFKTLYNKRAGIEGTISQAVRANGLRQARYCGLARTPLQHLVTAAAINFVRAARWLMGDRPQPTRLSPFAALVAA